ncbi:MAG: enolase C-terminal domain-like protein [Pseudomonadota bacterium]
MAETAPDLTIRSLRARAVMAPLRRPVTTATASIPAAPLVLIDLFCDQGVEGRAYIFGYAGAALRPLVDLVESLGEILAGRPLAPAAMQRLLEDRFRLLGAQGLLGMAISGVDMAAWDALGRAAGQSVARLLGGREDPIPCYDSHGLFNPETSPSDLEDALRSGFGAVKFKVGAGDLSDDVAALCEIRSIIGPDVRLMIDYNQSLSAPEAIRRLRRLAEFDLTWAEEPVPAEDFAGHAAVRAAAGVAIQTGENWCFPQGAANAIAFGVSDHAMPDLGKIGGVTGWGGAAALANAAALPISSHIFVEASAHVMSATPGAYLVEHLDLAGAILRDPAAIVGGAVAPRGPGLGLDWDERAVEAHLI